MRPFLLSTRATEIDRPKATVPPPPPPPPAPPPEPTDVPQTLDSLLSPTGSSGPASAMRTSLAESDFNDVSLDDESRFSTVPLSTRGSLDTIRSFDSIPTQKPVGEQRNSLDLPRPKSASTALDKTDSGSSARNSLLLARLDLQGDTRRASIEGQYKLQEEFSRLQVEKASEDENAPETMIDWDFWGDVVSDYSKFASQNSDRLAKAIEKGIPHTLRGMVWQLMSASKDPDLEATYLKLLKESSPHEKAIVRDLGRTFPRHEFFTDGQGIGQENLFNVLKAYSLYDPQVGYCQGLPFVVAILLLNMPDEEAFCLLVRLMQSYDLRGHFLPEMPKLQLRLFQFDRLIEELLPVLNIHFLRQGVKSSMFCSQWFLTLFSYRFPLDVVYRIYDNCLASGIEAIFGFSLVLLQKNEQKLLELKFDEILVFLNTKLFEPYEIGLIENGGVDGNGSRHQYDVDQFVQDAVSLRITPFMLDSYAHEYEDMCRARDAHALELDALRNSNRNLSMQVKNLENSLAQLNGEHVEVLNQLVMARLKNEELEGELVRYKLLYAEAMHQSADALSSHRISMMSKRGSSG
ncbi:hypothetical protein JAAARDRAFT_80643 [Jaapia argillacea MUCL 33604]|uniref:Rab-GAP TBC domain-containing protein n=1 Tax=Jaapia argillacea MUCL 33604 TaxID=933084 RepID=A0A067PI52_9AGAM|nr:hypothetical protein JAAARDRAFT_80643 [Jaapia argillacea MUCL 33604]